MNNDANPFGDDKDRAELWDLLVRRDIDAFVDCDWLRAAEDFAGTFYGIDAHRSSVSADWTLAFPTLEHYRENWLGFAQASAARARPDVLRRAHFEASTLTKIEISGRRAVCHKQLLGLVPFSDGSTEVLDWRTVYVCIKQPTWKIDTFIGFLPLPNAGAYMDLTSNSEASP